MLDSNGRPNCKRLPGFSFSDPSNEFKGCERDPIQRFNLDNTNLQDLYDMYTLDNIFWLNSSNYEELQFFNPDECQNSCLFDSNCVVAVEKSGTCYKKKLPVSNGRREQVNSKAFVKLLISSIPTGDFPYSTSDRGHRKKDKRPKFVDSSSIPETNLRNFTFQELKVATDSFKLELGRGDFGTVYKGEFSSSNSRTIIAVKKLDWLANDGENEFKTEASSKQEWEKRIRIAYGIARGILYLHEECDTQIIHCDIKPQNILLDDSFEARISHFGLAEILMKDQTRSLTGIRGIQGYVAPEWSRNTGVTAKVDVYSFGIVLLETICCRKYMDTHTTNRVGI
ncbi:G-type lectin S-receptor-like serine/threonine-protein kinase LECRK4 [Lycium barbarum]|uniref:G-type lectin S-receptor-like serine/threonine-protein kinase LECRK4 n=1 Tax=Lycium barbarum TaxID=112863 RepID=UPI00293E8696|nr:G-type lectin S-receptor-like serine/threonine-protein kinase LECRK4 [Lycium barbarum]